MDNIFNNQDLYEKAQQALALALDHMVEHKLPSVWTGKRSGWQELCSSSKFSGLYATCSAINLLIDHRDAYEAHIRDAVEELQYFYDIEKTYDVSGNAAQEEKTRLERCQFLLRENCNITMKAIFFWNTYKKLQEKGISISNSPCFPAILERVKKQIIVAHDPNTGLFLPAKGNTEDVSMMTTMYAFGLMQEFWSEKSKEILCTKKLLLNILKKYADGGWHSNKAPSKFDQYIMKRNLIVALYALSHSRGLLDDDETDLLQKTFFLTLADHNIRESFFIRESFSVAEALTGRDDFTVDAKVLYLESVLSLVMAGILPCAVLECFMDDLTEIIDTVTEIGEYRYWDMLPSFSHNVNGLMVLKSLIACLERCKKEFAAVKISPLVLGKNCFSTIAHMSVVLFMPFTKERTSSFRASVQEVLEYAGFNVWCAQDDPFDALVISDIWNQLNMAQFAIIDCYESTANVMYEAGLAHGLGKRVLLCGKEDGDFPYESGTAFQNCKYEPNGEVNPPPYGDLQKGIISFIKEHINDFAVSTRQKEDVIRKLDEFFEKTVSR